LKIPPAKNKALYFFTIEELRAELGVHSKANGKIFPVYRRILLPLPSEQKAYLLKVKIR
jgi:hypothetical protein